MSQSILHGLQVALDANAAAYRRAVQTSAPGDCWDFVVLTAANEKQAEGYRRELALRQAAVGPGGAFFPAIQRSLVVADPPGRRAGSGGATLGVMRALMDEHHVAMADFERLRILLIHSGGASQRLPAYSPLGKIFAPLPLLRPDGQIATLFDHLYLTLAGLPERLGPGMLILAGDVFLLFDHRHVVAPSEGVTALSMRVEAEVGCGHGVFATDSGGMVTHTLQKAPVQKMRQAGAVDGSGRVLIDSGLLFFDAPRTQLLAKLAGGTPSAKGKVSPGMHQRYPSQLDLYEDMTAALAAGSRKQPFINEGSDAAMRRELWKHLHGVPMRVMCLEGQFLHLGTTLQFRDAMVGRNPSPAAELFQQNVLTHSDWPLASGRRVYHSALLGGTGQAGSLGEGTVVEHSILGGASRIGDGCVISQVVARQSPLRLGDNLLLFQVPVRDSKQNMLYVQVMCGVQDDFKGNFGQGKCLYLNQPIEQFLRRHNLKPHDLWPDIPEEKRTLWTARIFPATSQRDAAQQSVWLSHPRPAPAAALRAWKSGPRYSMAMLLEQADPQALIEHRENVSAWLQSEQALDAIRRREDRPLESLASHYSSATAYEVFTAQLVDWSQTPATDGQSALDQARSLWLAAQLCQRADHPDPAARVQIEPLMLRSFEKVARASEIGHQASSLLQPPRPPGRRIVSSSCPVRLDLAGGWSDTPPFCFERGGHVINLAIDLEDRPPVRAICQGTKEPGVILESQDLGRQVKLTWEQLAAAPIDVRDPFALHRAALSLMDLPRPWPRWGLKVTSECRVPKGSGLGTSSILAAAMLAALHELLGRNISRDELMSQTLVLEQRLSTGGGWQDQVGGIVGGVKSIISAAGIPQRPVVEELRLSDTQYQQIQDRLVVYYSGQQRLARDILRRVEGRWLGREPAMLLLSEELKQGASLLRQALLKSEWKTAAAHMARYWQIKKELYPGSTTPVIDVLLLELREDYLAAGLAGAGGGGFAYFFCRDADQATRLRSRLEEQSSRPGSLGNLYSTRINRHGLRLETSPR